MKNSIVESSLSIFFRILKYENTIDFYLLGLIKSTQGRTHPGPNPSFFRIIKHVKMRLIEDDLTDHLLSSLSSLKNK
jgi:hypothetical protein